MPTSLLRSGRDDITCNALYEGEDLVAGHLVVLEARAESCNGTVRFTFEVKVTNDITKLPYSD